jgi:Flp pilus assembly protein TadB
VEWLLLGAFAIMWAALLLPRRRRRSATKTVEDFEHRMELLAYSEVHGTPGRWIVTPRKGMRFLGPQDRQRARARARRRRVLVALLEGLALSFLIGLVPPLHAVWVGTGALGGLLLLYVWALLAIKAREVQPDAQQEAVRIPARPRPVAARYVAEGIRSRARQTLNGLGTVGEGDRVHVVVRAASATG